MHNVYYLLCAFTSKYYSKTSCSLLGHILSRLMWSALSDNRVPFPTFKLHRRRGYYFNLFNKITIGKLNWLPNRFIFYPYHVLLVWFCASRRWLCFTQLSESNQDRAYWTHCEFVGPDWTLSSWYTILLDDWKPRGSSGRTNVLRILPNNWLVYRWTNSLLTL